MTEIREDFLYKARFVKSGENKYGPWEIILVQGKGSRQPTIAISVIDPPSGVGLSGMFRIDHIRSIMVRNWQDKEGVWHRGGAVTVRAVVVPVMDAVTVDPEISSEFDFSTEFTRMEDWFK